MRHGKIIQPRESRADQCGPGLDQEGRLCCKGSQGVGDRIRDFQEPGLSVCSRGKSLGQTGSGSGDKDCFYGQALEGTDPGGEAEGKVDRAKHKRDRHTGSGSFSSQGSKGWLERTKGPDRSNWNTALTDWQPRRLSRLINFWWLTGAGQRAR